MTGPPPPQHDSWTHVLKAMADTFEARLGATVDASADASTQAAQMAAVLSFVRRLVSPDVFPELRDIIDYYARVKIPRRFGNQRVELRKIETFLKSLRMLSLTLPQLSCRSRRGGARAEVLLVVVPQATWSRRTSTRISA